MIVNFVEMRLIIMRLLTVLLKDGIPEERETKTVSKKFRNIFAKMIRKRWQIAQNAIFFALNLCNAHKKQG